MANKITKLIQNGEEYLLREYVEPGWQPGANTIAYRPLNSTSTITDRSNNHYDLTNNGITFGIYHGVDCAYCNGATYLSQSTLNTNIIGKDFTVSIWVYAESGIGITSILLYQSNYQGWSLTRSNGKANIFISTGAAHSGISSNTSIDNGWHHLLFTHATNGDTILYVDGSPEATNNKDISLFSATNFRIGCRYWRPTPGNEEWFTGYCSNEIIENKVRTQQEVSDYFNQTKSLYGIS